MMSSDGWLRKRCRKCFKGFTLRIRESRDRLQSHGETNRFLPDMLRPVYGQSGKFQ